MAEPIAEYGNLAGICGYYEGVPIKVKVGADGALQIDVESTGNPSNLDIAISALRDAICAAAPTGRDLVDIYNRLGDLSDALGNLLTELQKKSDLTETQPVSLATMPTTTVQATGADKIFAFESVVANYVTGAISGASGYISSGAVPAGKIWVITNVIARDATSAITAMLFVLTHNSVGYDFNVEWRAIAAGERVAWQGHIYLDAGDFISTWFLGALAGDTCYMYVTGYAMDAPA
jgi:hypothetical protein